MFEWPSDPDLLFDAARSVESWTFDVRGAKRSYLVFCRRCLVLDEALASRRGVALAIFAADDDGEVFDWNERFESEGRSVSVAIYRFHYRFVNGLTRPINVRRAGELDEEQRYRLDAMFGEPHPREDTDEFGI